MRALSTLLLMALGCAAFPSSGCGARTNLACDFELTLRERPSLYFVLDRSGSMREGDKWGTVRAKVSELIVAIGSNARFGATVFPAPGIRACAPGVEVMPLRIGDEPGVAGKTKQLFLDATAVAPDGGTPTASTLDALAVTLHGAKQTFVVLATDGGPNCARGLTCAVEHCTANISGIDPRCQPGSLPNCCDASVDSGNPADCLDDVRTEAAVARLAEDGIAVFVIGIAGSGPYAELLDRLARAGGTAKTTMPAYYRIDSFDGDGLGGALSDIATRIGRSCRRSVVVPKRATVTDALIDGVLAPTADWTFDGHAISLTGPSCERVRSGALLRVRGTGECL